MDVMKIPALPEFLPVAPLEPVGSYTENDMEIKVYPARPAINYTPDIVCKPKRKRSRDSAG